MSFERAESEPSEKTKSLLILCFIFRLSLMILRSVPSNLTSVRPSNSCLVKIDDDGKQPMFNQY